MTIKLKELTEVQLLACDLEAQAWAKTFEIKVADYGTALAGRAKLNRSNLRGVGCKDAADYKKTIVYLGDFIKKAKLAKKAEANRDYRARRTQREQKAVKEAAALRANRGLDPTREEWLMRAAKLILKHVAELGFEPTGEVKVALGVPPQKGRKTKMLGICYRSVASEAAYREIFIHPEMTDSRKLLGVLTHEIGHAVLKDGVGHRAPFKKFCQAVGFDFAESGKAEHANDGADFWQWVKSIAEDLGPIPHKKLNCDAAQGQKKKQNTRMLLLECPCCASKVRTAKATLTAIFENTDAYIARCVDPSCDGEIDFEEMLMEVDGEGEEE